LAVYDASGKALPVDHGSSDWLLRVVPNKYASFATGQGESNDDAQATTKRNGPFTTSSQPGHQELLIPSPRHVSSISELDHHETRVLWQASQDRIELMQSAGVAKHAMLFMNCRSQAGASLEHIHIQLMGSPVVTESLAGRVQRNRDWLQRENETLVESIIQWEVQQDLRIISRGENFTVLCPFASGYAYQMWIVPNRRDVSFVDLGAIQRDELGLLCRNMVGRLEQQLHHPPYNMLLRVAPFDDAVYDHWYVEILPRTTRDAGFELGTDVWVNPMPPEMAAQHLRKASFQ
jgi:UDPglucose--hexose-1-phosphate uridylyltransferase